MSQYNAGPEKGIRATANLDEGLIVKLENGEAVVATAGTDVALGVTTTNVEAGQVASVRLRSAEGTSKVVLGGTVAAGAKVTAGAGGKAVATTTAGNEVVGIALESGVANDVIEIVNTTGQLVAGA